MKRQLLENIEATCLKAEKTLKDRGLNAKVKYDMEKGKYIRTDETGKWESADGEHWEKIQGYTKSREGYKSVHEVCGVKENPVKEDIIGHPDHYCAGRKHEPKDVIRDWNLNFNLGNAVKYISRNGRKDGNSSLQDLKKARQYLDFEISYLENDLGGEKAE